MLYTIAKLTYQECRFITLDLPKIQNFGEFLMGEVEYPLVFVFAFP